MYRLEEHGNSSKRDITFKQLNEIINQNGTSDRKLNALLTKSKLNATLSNRAEEDFIKYIDTTKIVEINIEGKSTYPMRIETNIEDGVNFYNLLVYEKNEELKQIIIKYMPDATFNPQIPEDFKGTIVTLDEDGNPKDIEVFEYNRMMFVICGYNFIPICICNAGNAHCMGASNCDAGGGHVIGYNITPNYCFLNVAGDGSDGGGGNTTPATTTGSGGTAGSFSTIAVYFSPADIRKKDFVQDELTPDERDWLFNPLNDASEQSIYAFLEQSLTDENGFVSTDYSTANINFVKEIINTVINYISTYGNNPLIQNYINEFISIILNGDINVETEEELILPPSCESFNFVNTAPNWQEAAVANIHFTVVVLSPTDNYINHIIEYPQAILFGVPRNFNIGNANVSEGLAANLSAMAIRVSMNETVKKYGNKPVSEMMVRLYFENRLKHNYPLITNGGRININPATVGVIPSQYITNAFGIGDCE